MAVSSKIMGLLHMRCGMVVVAAGSSVRMGCDKLTLPILGVPVLARTLQTLDQCACVEEIVLVTREDRLEEMAELCASYGISKIKCVVKGGKTRTESALAGLLALSKKQKYALIHDGARPLVTEEIVETALKCAMSHRNACPSVPVTDTIKKKDGEMVVETPMRSELCAVQTPQAFDADLVKAALSRAVAEGKEYSDDCAAVEALGVPTFLCTGSSENIKITAPMDVAVAEAILKQREAEK